MRKNKLETDRGSKVKKVDKDLCPAHHRRLEVIWVNDQVRICTNCALFGDHKNHDIREEAEVLNEISLRAELLIDIYQLIEQNKSNLGDQKEIDDLYNQFMTKQIALKKHVTNKFKEYYNELLRKEKDVLNTLERNFDSIEKTFEHIKQGPKKVMDAAEEWCRVVQDKMERFNNPSAAGVPKGQNYIAFDMLEDPNNEEDVIRVGEKVLEDLDKNIQPPIPQLQGKLKDLTVQFDEHFSNKLMMLCHVPIVNGDNKAITKGEPISNNVLENKPSIEIPKMGNSLLSDSKNNLLGSFDIDNKAEDDNLILNNDDEDINFLNQIPDPTDDESIPNFAPGDTDAAYDVISNVLENGKNILDLSNRHLGDEFFISMIESVVDFAEGEPLSIKTLNVSNNDITDVGCEKLWEFLIVNNDGAAARIADVDFSNNKIKDKSSDILLTLCEENICLRNLNISNNQFKSKLVLKKFESIKDKNIIF